MTDLAHRDLWRQWRAESVRKIREEADRLADGFDPKVAREARDTIMHHAERAAEAVDILAREQAE